ncbi:hypothetical protein TRFO_29301 [Tritrichomonas foetus]|uniref:RING-type domain-containing protein n=1 Tax=Tritrichomonas foetus TaxID=1144522 RepID=A0A1J4JWF1_9EUKA|nr:hypothetical protein TRFO_29301 [Tritrichomonas foetus]|eukprot:OHT03323.1 hypothetical protein TRFO_29301 [Tritrichomonas foetus]
MSETPNDDITPQLCVSHFFDGPCLKEGCNCIHLPEYQLTFDELLEFDDLFWANEQTLKTSPVRITLTDREKELINAPRPVLCDICKMPIKPDDHYYFPCCDVFTCVECSGKWPFPNCCPSCGIHQKDLGLAPLEKVEDVSRRNANILIPEIVKCV